MGQEIELKLSVPRNQVVLLTEHLFWDEYASHGRDQFKLKNTYFDTPDFRLKQVGIALRIREKQGAFYQALKTRGTSERGLTRRGEWEWLLKKPELDFLLIKNLDFASLKSFQFDALVPLFSTNFHRTCWNIVWTSPSARIEAALDMGEVSAQGKTSSICELELELLEGDESALMVVAEYLGQTINLEPCDKGKAEKGFQLINSVF